MRTGQRLSKLAAGRWVMEQGSAPAVVEQAVQALLGQVPDRLLTGPGRRYVGEVIRQLEREI
jgi:hypothetical protein